MRVPIVGDLAFTSSNVYIVLGFGLDCSIYGCPIASCTHSISLYTQAQKDIYNKLQLQYYKDIFNQVCLHAPLPTVVTLCSTTNKTNMFLNVDYEYQSVGISSDVVKNWYLSSMLNNPNLGSLVFDYDTAYKTRLRKLKETANEVAKKKKEILKQSNLITEKDLESGRVYKYPTSDRWLMYYKDNIFYTVTYFDMYSIEHKQDRKLDISNALLGILKNKPRVFKKLPNIEKTDLSIGLTPLFSMELGHYARSKNIDLNVFMRK